MLLVHLFVCFVRASICHFSFPLDVGGWLRFVTVALPGLFYYFFFVSLHVDVSNSNLFKESQVYNYVNNKSIIRNNNIHTMVEEKHINI